MSRRVQVCFDIDEGDLIEGLAELRCSLSRERHVGAALLDVIGSADRFEMDDDLPAGYDPDEDRSPDSFDPPDRDEVGEW